MNLVWHLYIVGNGVVAFGNHVFQLSLWLPIQLSGHSISLSLTSHSSKPFIHDKSVYPFLPLLMPKWFAPSWRFLSSATKKSSFFSWSQHKVLSTFYLCVLYFYASTCKYISVFATTFCIIIISIIWMNITSNFCLRHFLT